MIRQVLSNIKSNTSNDQAKTRRRHSRRHCDRVVASIAGTMYPVADWSLGGLLINGDGRMFTNDQQLDITLKFKLRNDILDIPHKVRVVRRNRDKIGFEFMPLTTKIRKGFQQVVDDYVAQRFADSQMA